MARNPSTAGQEAAIRLQKHIVHHGLMPGDRLGREDELLELLGTSRTVLREALRLLAGMHMIQVQRGPGGGVVLANSFDGGVGEMVNESVRDLLRNETISLDELLEARIALEVPLAGIAARIADEQMTTALYRAFEQGAVGGWDRQSLAHNGATFHQQIADLGMNRLVGGITSWMFDVLQPELLRLQGSRVRPRDVIQQHREIFNAIAARDPEAAEAAMLEHLRFLGEKAGLAVCV